MVLEYGDGSQQARHRNQDGTVLALYPANNRTLRSEVPINETGSASRFPLFW
jgi:hypothetical protein